MNKAAGHILKSNNVKLEGSFRLDAGENLTGSASGINSTSSPAQVRIVKDNPEFAVIEFTCSCGTKTYIRCEYTDSKSIEQGLN